jgi:FkbM family methyltransferase
MIKFKSFLKKIIKTISGYELRGLSRGSFGLARENIEMQWLYPASLILMEKTDDEIKRTEGTYDYLRQLRLKTILEKYQINIVLDVGANKGQFAADLRHIDYKGRIISFEPISSAFAVLKEASRNDPNWDIHQLALGRQNGEQKINVADASVFTSFLKSNSWCEQEFGKNSVGSKEETVIVRRLDEVLNETVGNLDKARMYLKMDTQGYDLEVFMGLGSMYERIFALQSEMSVIPIYQDMPHLTDSISFFEKAGFEIAGMYPVVQEKSTIRIIEFDCLMVNSRIQKEFSNAI